MKKLVLIALALMMIVGCGPKKEEESYENGLDKILKTGKLIVSTSPDYPPMEFIGEDGKVTGSDMKLAQYIADELGVELVIETMDFNATLTALDFDKADLAISGFGWQADREDSFELSIGYNNGENSEASCQGLLIKASDVDKYQTLEDFAGAKVAAQANSLQLTYAETQLPGAQIEVVSGIDTGLLSLQTGKVDAVSLSCNVAVAYANSDANLAKAAPDFVLGKDATAGNMVAAKKGEVELIEKVNEILEKVNAEGLYEIWDAEAKAECEKLGIEF